MVRKITLKAFLASFILACSINAHSAPLGLTLADTPDIASAFINVMYNSASGTLTAQGFALQFTGGAPESSTFISGGLFAVSASVDSAGNLVTNSNGVGGSLTIAGTINSLGYTSGTLLTGDIVGFGFLETGDPLEFLFRVTGGDLAPIYGSLGGIILGLTGFDGSFDGDFFGSNAVADTAVIPLPGAVWLMFSALAGLMGFRKK